MFKHIFLQAFRLELLQQSHQLDVVFVRIVTLDLKINFN